MKKLLLTVLLAATCLSLNAQENRAWAERTFFWSINGGGTYYMHSGTSQVGVPFGGIHIGRWIMRPLAFRIAGDILMTPSYSAPDAGNATFIFGTAEFMWDVNSTFFAVHNETILKPFPVYPLIGLGLAYRPISYVDRDFQAMLGFQFPVRVGSNLDLYLEYKCFFLPHTFDGSDKGNMLHAATIGLTHRWSDTPFRRKGGFETRTTRDDWFTGFGIGTSFSSFDFVNLFLPEAKYQTVTGAMFIGRNFSSVWTIRAELSGFFGREQFDSEHWGNGSWYTWNCIHADFMMNVSHLGNFKRGVKWNFLPYAGAGPAIRYKDDLRLTVAADAGLFIRRYIDEMGDFYIDLKYTMVPPRFAGGPGPSGSIYGVGYPSLTIGYIANFGRSTTRFRMPLNQCTNRDI